MTTDENPPCSLYLITPPAFDDAALARDLGAVLEAAPGLVTCLQLRLPGADRARLSAATAALMPLCHDADVALLLCDEAALAMELGCDGVHLEMESSPKTVKALRNSLGADAIIGASCQTSRHTGMLCAEGGADYVSFGPVYASATKALPAAEEGLETLGWWAQMMEVPCVAVGGITAANCAPVVSAGADFIATIGGLWNAPEGPAEAAAAFAAAIRAAQG